VLAEQASKRADLQAVRAAPVPSADVKKRFRVQLNELAEQGRVDCFRAVEYGDAVEWLRQRERLELAAIISPSGDAVRGFAAGEVVNNLAFMAWVFGPAIQKAVEAEIDNCADDKAALTDQQRSRRVSELSAELLTLERAEVDFTDMVGGEHRPDVDPRALLRLSGDLPAPVMSKGHQ
jgi:hypothetical protein